MYVTRDIFQLKFGHAREAATLLKSAREMEMFADAKGMRALTDFTGDAYRLILEQEFESLAAYETTMQGGMANPDWKKWYEDFKQHVESSHREILKVLG